MTSPLVTTDWLIGHLDDPDLVVIDASWHMPAENRDPRADFAAGHIPGAVFFDIDQVADHSSSLPHMLPEPQEFATAVRRLGVEPKGGSDALRPYLGKWIAMDEEREIRASGDTFEEVLSACDRQGLQDPEFLFVQPPGFIGGAGG